MYIVLTLHFIYTFPLLNLNDCISCCVAAVPTYFLLGGQYLIILFDSIADFLLFSQRTIFQVYREWSEKENVSSKEQRPAIEFPAVVRREWADWFEMLEKNK